MIRSETFGRFESRLELAAFIWMRWVGTSSNVHDIAVSARVSDATVHRILTIFDCQIQWLLSNTNNNSDIIQCGIMKS